MSLFKRKPREPITLDPEMEERKRVSLAEARERTRMNDAARNAREAREKVCGASPVGHVYEITSRMPRVHECVGCGHEIEDRY